MKVHLVNPSHVSFGVGVITPRWLLRPRREPRPRSSAIRSSPTKRSSSSTCRRSSRATSSASASIPATRCAATKSAGRARSAAPRSSSAASTPRCIPTKRTSSAGPTPSSRATATRSGARCSPTACAGTPQPIYEGGRIEAEDVHAGALGPAAGRALHVGVGADRARLPEALLVLLGVADRRPAAAPARRRTRVVEEIVELRRKGFRFIALADDNFYPVTLDDLHLASRRADPTPARTAAGDARRNGSS